MFGSAQSATQSADYDLALTIIQQWNIYRTPVIAVTIIFLVLAIIFMIRKSSWAKWFFLLTIITGASIFVFDGFKVYVAKREKTVMRETVLAPVTNTVGRVFKGVFGGGN
jgi:hypothetical protein